MWHNQPKMWLHLWTRLLTLLVYNHTSWVHTWFRMLSIAQPAWPALNRCRRLDWWCRHRCLSVLAMQWSSWRPLYHCQPRQGDCSVGCCQSRCHWHRCVDTAGNGEYLDRLVHDENDVYLACLTDDASSNLPVHIIFNHHTALILQPRAESGWP